MMRDTAMQKRDWHLCRRCGDLILDDSRPGVRYGKRHWMHCCCYLDASKELRALSSIEIEKFPVQLLKERGLLTKALRLCCGRGEIER